MTDLLRSAYPSDPAEPGPVLLFSDVDELPSRKTAALVQACAFAAPELGAGSALHLGMRSFLYSFEWEEGGETSSWRATAVEWPQRSRGSDEFYRCVALSLLLGGCSLFIEGTDTRSTMVQ
mgnify:CR=1 FL=1